MSLVKCGECGNEVSSKATSCPHCGNPIAMAGEVADIGIPLTTTQATAKKFKGNMLAGRGLIIAGLLKVLYGDFEPKQNIGHRRVSNWSDLLFRGAY